MSVTFHWDDAYSVGREDIDAQHKRLFELANGLPERMGQRDVMKVVMGLYHYTRVHFAAEEAAMREMGYPKQDAHRALHDDLVTRLNAIGVQSFQDDHSVLAFKAFVYQWLVDHILNHDLDYARFARARQAGA